MAIRRGDANWRCNLDSVRYNCRRIPNRRKASRVKEALCGSADHLATMASAGRARVVKCHDIQKSASALAALLRQA